MKGNLSVYITENGEVFLDEEINIGISYQPYDSK
jgi:hypothetical protein